MVNIPSTKSFLKEHDIKIIDSHCHPFDVIGIHEPNQLLLNEDGYLFNDESIYNDKKKKEKLISLLQKWLKNPTITEKFNFNIFANLLTKLSFRSLRNIVRSSINEYFMITGSRRLIDEMDNACIERTILIPISPWLNTEQMYRYFSTIENRVYFFGSVDLYNEDVETSLKHQLSRFNIIGIKLHPNLQGFLPIPEKNPTNIKNNLETIYKFAENHHMPILFHAGRSYLIPFTGQNELLRESSLRRKTSNGLLINFFNDDQFVFKNYTFPLIFAHLGGYALFRSPKKLIKLIMMKRGNVYFDTAGVNPKWITSLINEIPFIRLIFGTDAHYYKQGKSVDNVINAVQATKLSDENKIKVIKDIFQNNIQNIITNII